MKTQPQQTEPFDLSMQKSNEEEIKSLKLSVLKKNDEQLANLWDVPVPEAVEGDVERRSSMDKENLGSHAAVQIRERPYFCTICEKNSLGHPISRYICGFILWCNSLFLKDKLLMTLKLSTYICVVLFGSTSWLSTNSVWLQLPLLTKELPEGWSLPSYLTVVVQIATVGSLVYSIIRKYWKISFPTAPVILVLLLFCCSCTVLMGMFWCQTFFLFGQKRSVALMILLFGMALVNGTSNVLFMPYMATFNASYLTAYFVGMGLSSLFPSIISILQGSGNECVTVNGTSMQTNGILQFEKELPKDQSPIKSSLPVDETGSLNVTEFSLLRQHTETHAADDNLQVDKLRLDYYYF
ncbi:Riboflavin transporter 2 [Dirofilaria immitis]|nr:Riboflavin transporter 2 [Dirofilaria immitis]